MGSKRFIMPGRASAAAVLLLLAGGALASAQSVPLASADLRLPSEGAGTGGTLAVRLSFPASEADYRYLDGAPVAVYLPGGMRPGSLSGGERIAEAGFVVVKFLFPGGREGSTSSNGVYDDRGDACQQATRDVILFAMDAATDSLGRTIDDIVPGKVRRGIVGLSPFSNGLVGLVTLGRYGKALPYAPYQVGWENPTSAQIVTGDLGMTRDDCNPALDSDGDGVPGDDIRNPWYDPATGYSPTTLALDFSRLEFDPAYPKIFEDNAGVCASRSKGGAVFHDGRANGRVDFVPAKPGCFDLDADGALETTEDYVLGEWHTFDAACALKLHYAPETTRALRDRGVFSGRWPPWIATVEETEAFWQLRDATRYWDAIAALFPRFKAMTVFTRQDHMQSQVDHPSVRQAMDGMLARGLWYRLNADAYYYQAVNGSLPGGYVETPANAAVPAGSMKAHAEPLETPNAQMAAAGHAEMADRLYSGCFWPDLFSSLRPGGVPETEARTLSIDPGRISIRWTPAAGAFCYDVLRGDVAALAIGGGRVNLVGATCVENDSSDAASNDLATPAPGRAWYYIVKPNGIDGTYGTASDGSVRTDAGRACGG